MKERRRLFVTADAPFAMGVPAILWQILFFYAPLLLLFATGLFDLSKGWSWERLTFAKLLPFFSFTYLKLIGSSLLMSLGNALLCFAVAFPLAYFLVFRGKRYKNLLIFLLLIPFWTNFLLHIYAWFFVLERHGVINTALMALQLIDTPLPLMNSLFAVMVMMVYYYLPFMLLPIFSSLEKIDPRIIEASVDLGASFSATMRRILLPLSMGGIRLGFFLVFIPSFGEFAIPELLGGDKWPFVGNVISQFILGEESGSLGTSFTVVSLIFLLGAICLLSFIFKKVSHDVRKPIR